MEKRYTLKLEKHPNLISDIRKKYIRDNKDLRNVTFSLDPPVIFYDYLDKTRVFIKKCNGNCQIDFRGGEIDILGAKGELESKLKIKLKSVN